MRTHHRYSIWALLLAVVTVSLVCTGSFAQAADSAPSGNTAQDRSAQEKAEAPVRALVDQMFEAYNRGDVSGASARFAPDGDMVAGDGTVVSTRAGNRAFLVRPARKAAARHAVHCDDHQRALCRRRCRNRHDRRRVEVSRRERDLRQEPRDPSSGRDSAEGRVERRAVPTNPEGSPCPALTTGRAVRRRNLHRGAIR